VVDDVVSEEEEEEEVALGAAAMPPRGVMPLPQSDDGDDDANKEGRIGGWAAAKADATVGGADEEKDADHRDSDNHRSIVVRAAIMSSALP